MTEQFLHYLFETRKLGKNFVTTDGEELEVKEFGSLNHNSGPDFLVAKVKYKQTVWAGHIEFHKNSSDWFSHGHQNDSAYKNVIAHFVYHHDREIYSGDYRLPTVELKNRIDDEEFKQYQRIIESDKWVACKEFPELNQHLQKELPIQIEKRLKRKAEILQHFLNKNNGDLKKTLLYAILQALGGKANKNGFEILIQKVDFQILRHLNFDEFKLQAYFHGLSSLMPVDNHNPKDEYLVDLIQEFNYQQKLFDLSATPKELWKFSTFRPASHPTNRIAQLAAWLSNNSDFSQLLSDDIKLIKQILDFNIHEFWLKHYHFKKTVNKRSAGFSDQMKNHIIINAIIPFIFLQSNLKDQPLLKKKAVNLLKALPAESNRITKSWESLGIENNNAYRSQALIELKNEYCKHKKCLNCIVGKEMLNR